MKHLDKPGGDDDFARREAELAAGKYPVQTQEEIETWAKQVLAEQQPILDRLAR